MGLFTTQGKFNEQYRFYICALLGVVFVTHRPVFPDKQGRVGGGGRHLLMVGRLSAILIFNSSLLVVDYDSSRNSKQSRQTTSLLSDIRHWKKCLATAVYKAASMVS